MVWAMKAPAGLAEAGGRVFIAGDFVKLYEHQPSTNGKIVEILSAGYKPLGTGNPHSAAGCR